MFDACAGPDGLSTFGDSRWKDPNEKGNAVKDAMEDNRGPESFEEATTGSTDARLPLGGTLREGVSGCEEAATSLLW